MARNLSIYCAKDETISFNSAAIAREMERQYLISKGRQIGKSTITFSEWARSFVRGVTVNGKKS